MFVGSVVTGVLDSVGVKNRQSRRTPVSRQRYSARNHPNTPLRSEAPHSRPRTSNDNAFSEAQFKTVKHHPTYPKRFDGISHARQWINDFMNRYNTKFYHSGIGLMTPATVHYGHADRVIAKRQATLDAAYQTDPARFRNRPPKAPRNPTQVWINKPEPPPESTDQ